MKNLYRITSLILLTLCVALPTTVNAQDADTLLVSWLDGDELAINALYNAIVADTIAGGERKNPNRVYKLERGGFYYNTERIENQGWHLRIVGEKGDPTDEFANPPMLQLEHRESDRTDKLLQAGGSVTLKNLIINGKTTQGDLPYEIISFNAEDETYVIDNVTFEYAAWGIIAFYGINSDISITNSRFRNLASTTEYWGGRGLSVWVNVNKLLIENNTFMNIGGFAIQLEGGVAQEAWINHNTFVNVGRQVFLHGNHLNTYFTNNLIVNGYFHGEGSEGFGNVTRLSQADNQFSGIFNIEPLPSAFGLEVERKIVFSNNSHFRDQVYENYYASTSGSTFPVRSQPMLNVRTLNYFDQYDGMVVQNNFDGPNPGIKVAPDNPQEQIDFVISVRTAAEVKPLWYWDPGRVDDNYSIQWPFPEDLSYTNTTHQSAAFGGFPLGDLNWFPAQKSAWMSEKDAIEAEIKALAGEGISTELVSTVQAELGDLTGSASIVELDDKFAARVAGAGNPSWTFNMDAAGTYDISVKHRTWYNSANPDRATNLVVNGAQFATFQLGINITEALEWGEPIIEDVPLVQGVNTIQLGRNWGYAEYLVVTIKDQSGTVVEELWASKATDLDGAELHCANVISGNGSLCAVGDAYADVSSGGLNVPVSISESGVYIVQLKGTVIGGGTASANVSVNGSLVSNLSFTSSDSVFVSNTSDTVNLTAGTTTISIGSVVGSLGIDEVYLFKVSGLSTSIGDDNLNPNGFKLSQNYPNPFNPTTNIQFNLPVTSSIKLTVHNVLGQTVAILADGMFTSGLHNVQFNGRGLASGMYFYRLQSGTNVSVKKMTLIK